MRKFWTTVLILCCCLAVGCGQQEKQRELNICSSMGSKLTEVLAEGFAQEADVKVNIKYLPPGSFRERMDFIRENNIDCWLGGTAEEYYLASQQNLLQPYLAEDAYKVPAEMRSREGYWTSLYLEYIALLSNKEKLRQFGLYAPDTWTELLQPAFRDEIVMTDFSYGGASYGMITSVWQLQGKEAALQYAAAFNRQNITYTDSLEKTVQLVYSGEKTIAVLPLKYALHLENRYRHLFATVVEDANRNLLTGAAVIKGSANAAEAQKFLDYLMNDKSMNLLAENGYDYMWHVKYYPHNTMRRELLGNIAVPSDDLSWTAVEKNEIIRQWLSAT